MEKYPQFWDEISEVLNWIHAEGQPLNAPYFNLLFKVQLDT